MSPALDNAVLEMVGQSLLFMWHSKTPCGRTITHAWIHVQTDMRQRTNNTTETNTKRIRCSGRMHTGRQNWMYRQKLKHKAPGRQARFRMADDVLHVILQPFELEVFQQGT